MLKLKSQLTCSYCSKIFKDPIQLPCEDSICCGHLRDRDVVKQNKIKCNKCKQEFQVKDCHFKSNETLKKLIDSQSYLSNEEISLKQELFENSLNSMTSSFKIKIQSNSPYLSISKRCVFK
jgi:hypothetical protein